MRPEYPWSQVQVVWNSVHILASEGFVSVWSVSVVRKMRQEQSTREKAGERRRGNFPSSFPRILLSPYSSQDHLLRRLPTFQPTVQACFCMPALQATHVLSQRAVIEPFSPRTKARKLQLRYLFTVEIWTLSTSLDSVRLAVTRKLNSPRNSKRVLSICHLSYCNWSNPGGNQTFRRKRSTSVTKCEVI